MCYYAKGKIDLTIYGVSHYYPHFTACTSRLYATGNPARHCIAFGTHGGSSHSLKDGCFQAHLSIFLVLVARSWTRTSDLQLMGLTSCRLLYPAIYCCCWLTVRYTQISLCTSYYQSVVNLEPIDGLEPPTYWLQISCSANWAIPAYLFLMYILYKKFFRKSSREKTHIEV